MTAKKIREITAESFGHLLAGHEGDPLELLVAKVSEDILVAARIHHGMCPLFKLPALFFTERQLEVLREIVAGFNEREGDLLLAKYMGFVYREEGSTFVARATGRTFTDLELARLEVIDREVAP